MKGAGSAGWFVLYAMLFVPGLARAGGSPDIIWQGAHNSFVRYTAFSPDGQQLATGGDDRNNKIWAVSDGSLLRTIVQCSGLHCTGPIFGSYSPDSQQLATNGLKFWQVSTGTLLRTLSIGGTLAFSPDWQFVASSVTTSNYPSQVRTTTLFRVSDGSQLWTISGGGGATAYSPNGQLIASIGFQGIDIIRASDGVVLRNIVGPRGGALAFSHDGQLLATNGGAGGAYRYDDTIKLYRVSDGALVRILSGTGIVTSIVFTPNDELMLSSSSDQNESPEDFIEPTGAVRVWRVADGAVLKTYDQNTGTSAGKLAVSPDGQYFSYAHDSTVVVARIPIALCSFSISPAGNTLPVTGGSGSVTVSASPKCSWTATSRVGWITITSGSSGTGNGTVTYTTSGGRDGITGLLIVAEQTFPVQIGADPCSYTVSPTSDTWSSFGGSALIGVQSATGCGWTASSNDSWLTIRKISTNNGSGSLTYAVAPNSGGPRTGTLTVAGQTITISQVTTPCSYTVSPTSQAFSSIGGNGNVLVTSMNGCPWTATSDSGWLHIGIGSETGAGTQSMTYWLDYNGTTSTRVGHLTVAGTVVPITQTGITCGYTISPANRSFNAEDGAAYMNMAAPAACSWSATSNDGWITVGQGGSGSGYGTIYYSVAANNTGNDRTGTITIMDKTFSVFQSGEVTQGAPDILWSGNGHTAQVNAVAFSPDGQTLASASDDRTVRLWRVSDGALLGVLPGHFDRVTSVAFSHGGQMLASGGMDRNIKLWNTADRSLIRSMGSSEFIFGVAFAANDLTLASAGGYSTNEIKFWRVSDGQNIGIYHDNYGQTNGVSYSPDGQFLASAQANDVAELRPAAGGNPQILGHDGTVNSVAFSSDSQLLVTASDDASVSLWQSGSGARLFNLNGPSGFAKSAVFSPDGQTVLAAGQDYSSGHGSLVFWRVSDGSLMRTYAGETSTAVYGAAFSPDGTLFAYGRADGRVVVAHTPVINRLQLTSVVSRKAHGAAGSFDVDLPLNGTPGVECRSSGGNHELVFTFSGIVTEGDVIVSNGTAEVAGTPGCGGRTMHVNLTGVPDAQTLTLTLENVTDTSGHVMPAGNVRLSLLVGDTNSDGVVNSADAQQTRNRSGQATGPSNFRWDVNVDGSVNGGDTLIVRGNAGQALP